MMSPRTIKALADEHAEIARTKDLKPWYPRDEHEVDQYVNIPFLGSYRPDGFVLTDSYLVDKTGLGRENEPAMTQDRFKETVKRNFRLGVEHDAPLGYAVIEEGPFQVVVGVFKYDAQN